MEDALRIEAISYQTTLKEIYRAVAFEQQENDGKGTVGGKG